ncbi:citrate/2-methylcitrate synthase [Polaromonas sp.]|uniref:citrate/2-methylcitrate synthase n=1 Tax=Polaromonas sp. TaxID=1869339 RepID=UPI00352B1CFD
MENSTKQIPTPKALSNKQVGKRREVNDVQYITSTEALSVLGVRRETFYTYVSRGLIKSQQKTGTKTKLYRKADVEKLRTRAAARTGVPTVSQSLRYGEPIVQTWISEITARGPRYRGHLALDLVAQKRSFEFVAELLWTGLPRTRNVAWPQPLASLNIGAILEKNSSYYAQTSPLRQLAFIAAGLSAMELGINDPDAPDVSANARALIQLFAGAAGLLGPQQKFSEPTSGESIAHCLARGFAIETTERAVELLDAALVLSAEHELSAPTFAVRICASTGADLFACVAAGLSVQSGPMQVGGTLEVERLVDEVTTKSGGDSPKLMSALPCFGHPLYDKDPRATLLLELARQFTPQPPAAYKLWNILGEANATGQCPNIFAALVFTSYILGLPLGSGAFIHTLGRTAGWIAHATEQRLTGTMLRPRARFMGAQTS